MEGASLMIRNEYGFARVRPDTSDGHICFVRRVSGGWWEYFARQGSIWRMDSSAPIMPDGFRCGRWYAYDREDVRQNLRRVAA